MEVKIQGPVVCRQCRKEIKAEVVKCVPCDKLFHPGCAKLHKAYNKEDELVLCKGKTEVFTLKSSASDSGSGGSSGERKIADAEGGRASGSTMDSKIDAIYRMIREIKNEMVGKNLIKQAITEAVDEEMDRVRQEIQTWKEAELKTILSSIIKKEIKMLADANGRNKYSRNREKEEELQRCCV